MMPVVDVELGAGRDGVAGVRGDSVGIYRMERRDDTLTIGLRLGRRGIQLFSILLEVM